MSVPDLSSIETGLLGEQLPTRLREALDRGYPRVVLAQLLRFETAVQNASLDRPTFQSLYERGAPIFNVGFQLPSTLMFTEFLGCFEAAGLVFTWETWSAEVDDGGKQVTLNGRCCEVWRPQSDGVWRMAYDHASMSLDFALALRTTTDIHGMG